MDEAGSTALLQRARYGEREALDRLYAGVSPRLLALIRLRLGPALRAQLESRDLLQATLLKSFERLDQFDGTSGGTLMAWLARIAEHEIRDRADFHARQRRDAARDVPLDDVLAEPAAAGRSALSAVVLSEEALRLERALETLTPLHREVIVLRKLEEHSFREIATRLDRSEDACRMLLARALAALTVALGDTP
jgi:RNA polymerase sigma-70 factor (ECF subfamily)